LWDRPNDEAYYIGLQDSYYSYYSSAYEYGESNDYESCFVIYIDGDYGIEEENCDDQRRSVCEKPNGKIAIILQSSINSPKQHISVYSI